MKSGGLANVSEFGSFLEKSSAILRIRSSNSFVSGMATDASFPLIASSALYSS